MFHTASLLRNMSRFKSSLSLNDPSRATAGVCDLEARVGCPLITGLVVRSPAPPVHMSKCPWATHWTSKCPQWSAQSLACEWGNKSVQCVTCTCCKSRTAVMVWNTVTGQRTAVKQWRSCFSSFLWRLIVILWSQPVSEHVSLLQSKFTDLDGEL